MLAHVYSNNLSVKYYLLLKEGNYDSKLSCQGHINGKQCKNVTLNSNSKTLTLLTLTHLSTCVPCFTFS